MAEDTKSDAKPKAAKKHYDTYVWAKGQRGEITRFKCAHCPWDTHDESFMLDHYEGEHADEEGD